MNRLAFFITILFSLLIYNSLSAKPQANDHTKTLRIYQFDIREEIAPPVWRTTQKAFAQAHELGAGLMLIHMNTYGGMVDAADSIRTKILNSDIPVYVLIDNNAASAGALIAIACDSIYMVEGANIGAATVVNQSGEVVPDKYQSYMRSMMRSTAEARGRRADIAEAMVDPSLYVEGISDSGKVLTFTTAEAIKHRFCEAKVANVNALLQHAGHDDVEIIYHRHNALDKVINFLIQPFVSGLLIMLIVGGLYFELQTPGVGFPLVASLTAAVLYFAPLYLEGLATHIEIILFVVGLVLLLIEIFAIPGFGITGILGILLMISSLTLAMVEEFGDQPFQTELMPFIWALMIVVVSLFAAIGISAYLGQKLLRTRRFGHLALTTVQEKSEGFSSAVFDFEAFIGQHAVAHTMLRPAGKIELNGDIFDATLESGYADKGEKVIVTGFSMAQFIVRKTVG